MGVQWRGMIDGKKSAILPSNSAFEQKNKFYASIFGMFLHHARLICSYVMNFKELWFIPDDLLAKQIALQICYLTPR